MPIYDYACRACGHVTEVVHGIHDPGPRFCPECGAEGTMTKAFTTPTIHYKGSGWAKKDRSASSRPASTKKDDASSKPGGSGGDAAAGTSASSAADAGATSSGGSGPSGSSGSSTPAPATGD